MGLNNSNSCSDATLVISAQEILVVKIAISAQQNNFIN
jgi:hypothetical protein